jgi:hypothetical protein
MVDLKLDANHDIYLEGDDLALVGATDDPMDKIAEVAQAVLVTLKTQLGEYAWDTEAGFPYLEMAFAKNPDLDTLAAAFRAVVSAVDGVNQVLTVDLSVNKITRELNGTVEFDTPYGITKVPIA